MKPGAQGVAASRWSRPTRRERAWRGVPSLLVTVLLLIAGRLPADDSTPGLTFHAAPKPALAAAKAEDWPRFLGPFNNASSGETGLLKVWPKAGPALVWEFAKGAGWACPAIAGNRLVLFHRQNGREVVDCLQRETGQRLWTFGYDAPYRDRYGSSDGPRTSAVIAGEKVFVFGVTAQLHALDLTSGKELWNRDLQKDFDLNPNFFGYGSTPLVLGQRLILNLGGKDDVCAAALDTATGKTLWTAKHEWGASYASPMPATFHGRECVLVFAGGESRPPTGGLLCIDAKTGQVLNATPHRADIAESVSASSPVVVGNRVFVSESYGSGGEMIEIAPDFSAKSAWKSDRFGIYFMTPVVEDGCLFGFDGQQPRITELVCYEALSGKELWRNDLGEKYGRGSLLVVDGGTICLGEFGDLAWLELSRKGVVIKQQAKLFNAADTWTLPALSHGLLYVCQNERSADGHPPRLLCYDLRGE